MKNMLFALAALALAPVLAAAPAHAQSANDWRVVDEATDPGYQSAVRSGGYYGGYDRYNGVVVVDNSQADTTCVALILFCSSHPRRNRAGDLCWDARGVGYGLDRSLRWYRLPDSSPAYNTPIDVRMRCGFNTYSASGDAAPAAPAVTNGSGANYAGASVQTYIQDGQLVTVTTLANGDQQIHREPVRRQ